ncbi:AAC(3) family N-acetyltransferase [Devosia yakushimensis]|uniref:Aminoglycoside N(3)-acetyltransferase n=1 Tax=Devosia yakushimensis TaxID=470028 RepID=A0ABQ5UGR6_9HYPH|nr:AAC(3) family N-acetyltransferase [Devosia yakushimensis]
MGNALTEPDQVLRTAAPVTRDSLLADIRALGVKDGDLLVVHSSLSALGWVNGGAVAVVQALLDAIGKHGTLVMPAHSAGLTDPQHWEAPPVPKAWHRPIRDTMPAFDPQITPTRQMGQVAELFRTWPGSMRSNHPSTSFSALGPLAGEVTQSHDLADPFGEHSPLGALYRLGASILLMGVDFDTCTALHLAERRYVANPALIQEGAPMLVNGKREWVSFNTPAIMDSAAFLPIGAGAIEKGLAQAGPLGEGRGIFVQLPALVDHAIDTWAGKAAPGS